MELLLWIFLFINITVTKCKWIKTDSSEILILFIVFFFCKELKCKVALRLKNMTMTFSYYACTSAAVDELLGYCDLWASCRTSLHFVDVWHYTTLLMLTCTEKYQFIKKFDYFERLQVSRKCVVLVDRGEFFKANLESG